MIEGRGCVNTPPVALDSPIILLESSELIIHIPAKMLQITKLI